MSWDTPLNSAKIRVRTRSQVMTSATAQSECSWCSACHEDRFGSDVPQMFIPLSIIVIIITTFLLIIIIFILFPKKHVAA